MAARAAANRALKIAEGLLSCPTATLFEEEPARFIQAFAGRRRRLALETDVYGNLILKYPARRRPKAPPLVLVAHLDHPGFHVEEVQGRRAQLAFRGGVLLKHARAGARLEFFARGSRKAVGQGTLESASSKGARSPNHLGSASARITSGLAASSGYAMWRFPGFSLKKGWIISRCCDDLLGAAAALATLDEIHRRAPKGAHVWGLFTRAEEVGLLGALGAARTRSIPKTARVISLETSRALPHAPAGAGVIVRVGDARSLFEPRLMGALHRAAMDLASQSDGFRFQRRLMDGGVCEASAFCAAGFRSGGIALPLVNYHNMKGLDGGEVGIGAEMIRASDYFDEVELLARLSEDPSKLLELESRSEAWVSSMTKKAHRMLRANPIRVRVGREAGRSRRA